MEFSASSVVTVYLTIVARACIAEFVREQSEMEDGRVLLVSLIEPGGRKESLLLLSLAFDFAVPSPLPPPPVAADGQGGRIYIGQGGRIYIYIYMYYVLYGRNVMRA